MGWSDNFEIFHKEKSGVLEKNLENKKTLSRQPFMLELGSENLTNHKAALRVRQPMAAWFSDIFYLKQFTPKKM